MPLSPHDFGQRLSDIYNEHYGNEHNGGSSPQGHSASESGIGTARVKMPGGPGGDVPVVSFLHEGRHFYAAIIDDGPVKSLAPPHP